MNPYTMKQFPEAAPATARSPGEDFSVRAGGARPPAHKAAAGNDEKDIFAPGCRCPRAHARQLLAGHVRCPT